jgi:hypothetical protein
LLASVPFYLDRIVDAHIVGTDMHLFVKIDVPHQVEVALLLAAVDRILGSIVVPSPSVELIVDCTKSG